MDRIHALIMSLSLLINPISGLAAQIASPVALAAGTTEQSVILETTNPQALRLQTKPQADFDQEVLAPLRAAQAKVAAEAAAKKAAEAARAAAAAQVAATPQVAKAPAEPTEENWYKLRLCEAGNDYAKNTGNGYYGAYQYNLSTWNNYGGYKLPSEAPAEVQDAKAKADYARRGWSPWPSCSKKLS